MTLISEISFHHDGNGVDIKNEKHRAISISLLIECVLL